MASSPLHPPVGCEQRRYLHNTQKHKQSFWFSLFPDLLLLPSLFRSGPFGYVFPSFFLFLVADGSKVRAEAAVLGQGRFCRAWIAGGGVGRCC
jgi:hypothetical protein